MSMSNKEIMHFIMTNVIMNAPRPIGNTFELALPQELFAELYEEFQTYKEEDGLYHMAQNKWRIN